MKKPKNKFGYIILNTYLCTEPIKIYKPMATKKEYLEVGNTVNWRGAWGAEHPKKVKITDIEICKEGDKSGRSVESVEWSKVNTRKIVVNLDNGHWAYGTQLEQIAQPIKKEIENNKVSFTLDIAFSDDADITAKDVTNIMKNILGALEGEINNGGGIAPDEPEKGDYITETITISNGKNKLSKELGFNK